MSDDVVKLPVERRQEMFAALVVVQDEGAAVKASREAIAERFGVSVTTVTKVEDEGLDKRWPPFGRG